MSAQSPQSDQCLVCAKCGFEQPKSGTTVRCSECGHNIQGSVVLVTRRRYQSGRWMRRAFLWGALVFTMMLLGYGAMGGISVFPTWLLARMASSRAAGLAPSGDTFSELYGRRLNQDQAVDIAERLVMIVDRSNHWSEPDRICAIQALARLVRRGDDSFGFLQNANAISNNNPHMGPIAISEMPVVQRELARICDAQREWTAEEEHLSLLSLIVRADCGDGELVCHIGASFARDTDSGAASTLSDHVLLAFADHPRSLLPLVTSQSCRSRMLVTRIMAMANGRGRNPSEFCEWIRILGRGECEDGCGSSEAAEQATQLEHLFCN